MKHPVRRQNESGCKSIPKLCSRNYNCKSDRIPVPDVCVAADIHRYHHHDSHALLFVLRGEVCNA